jgi:hypothetical protein
MTRTATTTAMLGMALAAASLALAGTADAKRAPAKTREDYRKIAEGLCLALPGNTMERSPQQPDELRPLAVYIVTADRLKLLHAFICVDTRQGPRRKVQVAYTAFGAGVRPVIYGDNGEQCRDRVPDDTRALCKGHRALTEDTTIGVTKVPVAATSKDLEFGTMALVYTNYTPGLDPGQAHGPRWYPTPIVQIMP